MRYALAALLLSSCAEHADPLFDFEARQVMADGSEEIRLSQQFQSYTEAKALGPVRVILETDVGTVDIDVAIDRCRHRCLGPVTKQTVFMKLDVTGPVVEPDKVIAYSCFGERGAVLFGGIDSSYRGDCIP
jgi:hypothetical protein